MIRRSFLASALAFLASPRQPLRREPTPAERLPLVGHFHVEVIRQGNPMCGIGPWIPIRVETYGPWPNRIKTLPGMTRIFDIKFPEPITVHRDDILSIRTSLTVGDA